MKPLSRWALVLLAGAASACTLPGRVREFCVVRDSVGPAHLTILVDDDYGPLSRAVVQLRAASDGRVLASPLLDPAGNATLSIEPVAVILTVSAENYRPAEKKVLLLPGTFCRIRVLLHSKHENEITFV